MRRWWLPLAVLTVVAVCCLGFSRFKDRADEQNLRAIGELTAVIDGDAAGEVLVEVERNGRESWWSVDDTGEARAVDIEAAPARPRTQDCAGRTCYRVAGDALRVEVSEDGGATYAIAWQIDNYVYQRLVRTYPDVGDPVRHLSSRSVVVHATDGGHVVFVANGRDGLLFRDERGTWHRLGVPASGEGCCYYEPPVRIASDPQPVDLTWPAVVVVSVAILGSAGIALAVSRPRRYRSLLAVAPLAAVAGYGTYLAGHMPTVGMFPGFLYGVPLIVITLAVGVGLAVWFVRNAARATRTTDRRHDLTAGR